MALTIRKKLAPFWLKLDEKDPASAEFRLRPLTELEFIDVQNEASYSRKRFTLSTEGVRATLAYGLLDWKNVLDEDGAEIKYSMAQAEQLPKAVLDRLASKIISVSLLNDTEKKT